MLLNCKKDTNPTGLTCNFIFLVLLSSTFDLERCTFLIVWNAPATEGELI
jgi:hypothetical protein